MSIPEEFKQSKGRAFLGRVRGYLPHLYVPLLVVLIGITSFSLGRLSTRNYGTSPGVRIISPLVPDTSSLANVHEVLQIDGTSEAIAFKNGEVVASKNGTVYYLPWCSQISRIKPENLVRFDSAEMAEKRGYKPSSACKGLQ